MAGNIRLEVVTPEKYVVDEEVQIAVAPGTLGEFGVLIGHTPFLTTLKTGTVHYTAADSERAKSSMERAQQRLAKEKAEDIDFKRAKAALERALYRIRLAGTR